MFTLEQKVDLILRYIATNDNAKKSQLKKMVIKALESGESVPSTIITADDLIFDLLKSLGMPQHMDGHKYMTEAIKLYVSDQTYTKSMTKRLYPDIANKYCVNGGRVERTMRSAIIAVFDNGDLNDIERVFGSTISVSSGHLCNREFVTSCGNEILRRMKKLGIGV